MHNEYLGSEHNHAQANVVVTRNPAGISPSMRHCVIIDFNVHTQHSRMPIPNPIHFAFLCSRYPNAISIYHHRTLLTFTTHTLHSESERFASGML